MCRNETTTTLNIVLWILLLYTTDTHHIDRVRLMRDGRPSNNEGRRESVVMALLNTCVFIRESLSLVSLYKTMTCIPVKMTKAKKHG